MTPALPSFSSHPQGAERPPRALAAPAPPLRARGSFVLAALLTFAFQSHAAEPQPLRVKLDSLLAEHNLPSLTVLAWRNGEIVAESAAGVRRRGHEEQLTLDDRIHLGSDTKAMTATLVALAAEEGKLAWTSPLGDLLADSVPSLLPAWQPITLTQLLTHRSGLPANTPHRLADATRSRSIAAQRLEIAAAALRASPVHPPGGKYLYSNLGYIVAGVVLERAYDRAWEDLMREKLFAPLRITTGGFGAPPDSAWGHRADDTPADPATRAADNPPFLGPAGTAHMTMRDWAKFAALHLRGHAANPHRAASLLRPDSFARLLTPAPGENYAGGWITGTRPWARGSRPSDTGRTLTHAGSNTLWFCVAWLAPEIDFFVLAATNQAGPAATKACDAAVGFLIQQHARPAR